MWWLASMALAYEVDAWTPRTLPLLDSSQVANTAMEAHLDRALERVRRRCPVDPERTKRLVGRAVARETARRVRVAGRPGLSSLGHGTYSAYLETAPEVARVTTGTAGIFEEVRLLDAPVLALAGTAATVRLGDTLVGTDKVDHFLATGFDYLRWSRWTERPDRAVRRGVRTEHLFLGRLTSKAFSYGDLSANWSGYQFYAGLLGPDSVVQLSEEACVVRVADWDWSAWVTWEWDEFANPSVYGPRVRRALTDGLAPDRPAICASYVAREPDVPLLGRLPEQAGPFGLEGFCP